VFNIINIMKKPIKFLVDTANLNEIKEAVSLGFFSGVTTNPVIVAKETKDYMAHIKKILNIIPKDWDLSVEVRAGGSEYMIKQAQRLNKLDNRIRIKIPANEEGLKAAKKIAGEMLINMTVVKLPSQAILCQALMSLRKPKNVYLSLFCGRINQAGFDWKLVLKQISEIEWPGELLAASIKTPFDISEAIFNGADIVTAPLDVYKMALNSKIVWEDIDLFNNSFDGKNFEIK